MDYEGRLRSEIDQGSKAADLIRNPVFLEAFNEMRTRYATQWADTPSNAENERERLYVAINVLEDIYDHIVGVMQTGAMADKELNSGSEGRPVH